MEEIRVTWIKWSTTPRIDPSGLCEYSSISRLHFYCTHNHLILIYSHTTKLLLKHFQVTRVISSGLSIDLILREFSFDNSKKLFSFWQKCLVVAYTIIKKGALKVHYSKLNNCIKIYIQNLNFTNWKAKKIVDGHEEWQQQRSKLYTERWEWKPNNVAQCMTTTAATSDTHTLISAIR